MERPSRTDSTQRRFTNQVSLSAITNPMQPTQVRVWTSDVFCCAAGVFLGAHSSKLWKRTGRASLNAAAGA